MSRATFVCKPWTEISSSDGAEKCLNKHFFFKKASILSSHRLNVSWKFIFILSKTVKYDLYQ